jgi:hypothetical protein
MKTRGFITISCAVLAFCWPSAQAHDGNRNIASVDTSVHAGVEEQVHEPEPSQGATKRPTMFSSWSSQPAGQVPATAVSPGQATTSNLPGPTARNKVSTFSSFQAGGQTPGTFWAPNATVSTPDRATYGTSGKSRKRQDPFGILPLQHAHGSSTMPLALTTRTSAAPEVQGLPRLFDRKQLGLASTSFQSDFPRHKDRTKSRRKSVDRYKTAVSPAAPARQQN